ncbi:MAG: hypothetical protein JXP34_26065 [Planctomycetes bacterium]|nr:hypothetical protein [Planctomycetota bacterium]
MALQRWETDGERHEPPSRPPAWEGGGVDERRPQGRLPGSQDDEPAPPARRPHGPKGLGWTDTPYAGRAAHISPDLRSLVGRARSPGAGREPGRSRASGPRDHRTRRDHPRPWCARPSRVPEEARFSTSSASLSGKALKGGTGAATETEYYYSGWRCIYEIRQEGEGNPECWKYIHGSEIDEVVAWKDGGTTSTYDTSFSYNVEDTLGSVRNVLDGYTFGAVWDTYRYDAYGKLESSTNNSGNPILYTGRRYDEYDADDEWGLYYYRTRYYEPYMGRFISRDWIGIWGDAGNLGNGYAYLWNKPIDGTDPFGNEYVETESPHGRDLDDWIKNNEGKIPGDVLNDVKTYHNAGKLGESFMLWRGVVNRAEYELWPEGTCSECGKEKCGGRNWFTIQLDFYVFIAGPDTNPKTSPLHALGHERRHVGRKLEAVHGIKGSKWNKKTPCTISIPGPIYYAEAKSLDECYTQLRQKLDRGWLSQAKHLAWFGNYRIYSLDHTDGYLPEPFYSFETLLIPLVEIAREALIVGNDPWEWKWPPDGE